MAKVNTEADSGDAAYSLAQLGLQAITAEHPRSIHWLPQKWLEPQRQPGRHGSRHRTMQPIMGR